MKVKGLLLAGVVLVTLLGIAAFVLAVLTFRAQNNMDLLGKLPPPLHMKYTRHTRAPPLLPSDNLTLDDGRFVFDPYEKKILAQRPGLKEYSLQIELDPEFGKDFTVVEENADSFNIKWPESSSSLSVSHTTTANGALNVFSVRLDTKTLWSFDAWVNLTRAAFYGGAEMFNMTWPFSDAQVPLMPYVTSDIYKRYWGDVMERYWLVSRRMAVTIDNDVPLWLGMNLDRQGFMSLKSQYKDSIYSNFVEITDVKPFLAFKIWTPTSANTSLKDFHLMMVANHLGKPRATPDKRMLKYPIWSTWARYKKDINQSTVLEFAKEINSYKFNNSQIEIDDAWATVYGDMTMDPVKFPDPKGMIDELKKLGFRATLWVHPFANFNSQAARNLSNMYFWVKQPSGLPAAVIWWDGEGVMVDPTNTSAADWFVSRLVKFRDSIGLTAYKFDAGETNWLPSCFRLANATYPNKFSTDYARMAARLGNGIETRVGTGTQDLGIFVRIMDKDSRWGFDNGLPTIITASLTFGILGYPFALPDMIGGNAYGNGTNGLIGHDNPERELYVRWLEANALLAAVQFSIVPWDYPNDTKMMDIAQNMMKIREEYSSLIWELAQESVTNGSPIIRPMWWIGDESDYALNTGSQYLVGNDLIVAPILEKGATSRIVYIPPGNWKENGSGNILSGPTTIRVEADITQLPLFSRQR